MLVVKNGAVALESWQGEGEYLLTESPLVYDGWYDARVWCENPVALEHAIRDYCSQYEMLPYVQKVVGFAW